MADEAVPPKQGGGRVKPSRARGSRKSEVAALPARTAGRGKLKPAPGTEGVFTPLRIRGPLKVEGTELRPLVSDRKKAKPSQQQERVTVEATLRQSDGTLRDQLPPRRRRTRESERRGYVRFSVHVENGRMSIIDSHHVDSELVMPTSLHGEYAYEITDGSRLLHADTIPDLGVVRSFSNPQGNREQRRHHIYPLTSYDFDVRVPAAELSRDRLASLSVVLYRVKERAPDRPVMRDRPVGTQFERELREVTRLSGIAREELPESIRRGPRGKS